MPVFRSDFEAHNSCIKLPSANLVNVLQGVMVSLSIEAAMAREKTVTGTLNQCPFLFSQIGKQMFGTGAIVTDHLGGGDRAQPSAPAEIEIAREAIKKSRGI